MGLGLGFGSAEVGLVIARRKRQMVDAAADVNCGMFAGCVCLRRGADE